MSEQGQRRLAEHRQSQPIEELERKMKKASGRYSNRYWTAEFIDWAHAKGTQLWKKLMQHQVLAMTPPSREE